MYFQRFFILKLSILIPVKLRRRIYDTVEITYQLKYSISLMNSVAVCPPNTIINFKSAKEHAIFTILYGWQECFNISTNIPAKYVEIKCQLDATEVFIADIIACSTCFGHHYTHQLRVMCPVCRMLQHPANRTHNPQLHTRPAT